MKIGHVHLKIRDMKRSVDFYRQYLGMEITEQLGDAMVFMSAGTMYHELALQAVGPDAPLPRRHDVGLYHIAFEVPDKQSFVEAFQTLKDGGINTYPVDHRISWALYFSDPDGNGIEIYWDTRGTAYGTTRWNGVDQPLPEEKLAS